MKWKPIFAACSSNVMNKTISFISSFSGPEKKLQIKP